MSRKREGCIIKRKTRPGLWAQIKYTDETGRQRVILRKVANRTEGREVIKQLLRQIEEEGARTIDGGRMTFKQLADEYTEYKLQPPVYKGEKGETR